jgi:hypothetical protein
MGAEEQEGILRRKKNLSAAAQPAGDKAEKSRS